MKMMTCTGCANDGACILASAKRAALRGMGITSVKFVCRERRDVFTPGQAVVFTTFVTGDMDDEGRLEVTYPGHVIKQMRGKVLGYIKPGTLDDESTDGEGFPFEPKANGYVKMPLSRVRPDPTRPAADATVCDWCGEAWAITGRCERDPEYTSPGKCLERKAVAEPREVAA